MLSLSKHEVFFGTDHADPHPSTRSGEGERAKFVIAFVYMLRCRDGKYYVGSVRGDWGALERRVNEHNGGLYDGFAKSRRPVELVWHQECQRITDAIAAERQIKGWGRAKKDALVRGDWKLVSELARNYTQFPREPPE